jgi:hypothetical protein
MDIGGGHAATNEPPPRGNVINAMATIIPTPFNDQRWIERRMYSVISYHKSRYGRVSVLRVEGADVAIFQVVSL